MIYGHAYLQMISDPYKIYTNTHTHTQQHIQGHTQIQTHTWLYINHKDTNTHECTLKTHTNKYRHKHTYTQRYYTRP